MGINRGMRGRYSIDDASRILGISPRYLGEMMANGEVEVDRVGSVGGTKINFIPVDEIPRIREKLHQQREVAAMEDAREKIAQDREQARAEHDRLLRDADAIAGRYGFDGEG